MPKKRVTGLPEWQEELVKALTKLKEQTVAPMIVAQEEPSKTIKTIGGYSALETKYLNALQEQYEKAIAAELKEKAFGKLYDDDLLYEVNLDYQQDFYKVELNCDPPPKAKNDAAIKFTMPNPCAEEYLGPPTVSDLDKALNDKVLNTYYPGDFYLKPKLYPNLEPPEQPEEQEPEEVELVELTLTGLTKQEAESVLKNYGKSQSKPILIHKTTRKEIGSKSKAIVVWPFESNSMQVNGEPIMYKAQLNEDGTTSCNCMGWCMGSAKAVGGRRCKHTDAIKMDAELVYKKWKKGEPLGENFELAPAAIANASSKTLSKALKEKLVVGEDTVFKAKRIVEI